MLSKIATGITLSSVLLAMSGGVAMAASGYGPTTPTGPVDAPGSYAKIVQTATVPASGGTVHVSNAGGAASIDLVVPSGAFNQPTQIEVTAPDLSAVNASLPNLGFGGYSAVGGIGIKALDAAGQPVIGTFAKPLSLTLTGAEFGKPGEKVIEFTGAHSIQVLPATLGANSVTIQLTQDPDIAVINPPADSSTETITGATTTTTGLPFFGEALGAGIALFFGAVALGLGLRIRRSASRA
jgi:hypothetical protein